MTEPAATATRSVHRPTRLLRHLVAGAVAGAAGTVAMDAVVYRRTRRSGSSESPWHWELAAGVTRWSEASAPGQVGRKAEQLVLGHAPPDSWARATTNVVHWATGIGWGVQYGALAGATTRHPWWRALGLGPVAWSTSYVVLPIIGVYEPIWHYDLRTLGEDLSAHLAFGATTSAVFAATMALLGRRDR